MATGLIALLDDVAALAKVAAASLDDVGMQAAKAGVKAAGIVIDDAAVTPRYVVGFAANRELPIVGRIAIGSLKNKLFYLLPASLLLSFLAPWAITPLLMIGGAYLCYEGSEKVYEALFPHKAHAHEAAIGAAPQDPAAFEAKTVAGAIKTDFILSAEIMAITLATMPATSFTMQAIVLAVVAVGITVLVYGGVALIVKADDAGVALAQSATPLSSLAGTIGLGRQDGSPSAADRTLRPLTQGLGRGLVFGMPYFLKVLSIIGTAAMIWVGGGIIIHGLEEYGLAALGHAVEVAAEGAGHALPAVHGLAEWAVSATAAGVFGLLIGFLLIPIVQYVLTPALRMMRGGKASAGEAPPHHAADDRVSDHPVPVTRE